MAIPATPLATPTIGASGLPAVADPAWPAGAILRDVVRGGLAALIVGIVVAGLGGRLVMRLAAMLVPSAAGRFTENGFEIGAITTDGTLGLVVFVGLLATMFLAVIWVVVSPWLPASPWVRAAAAAVVAVALGTVTLVDGDNIDFVILAHDPVVIASLLVLIAATAPAMVVVDRWLDRHMPRPATPATLSGVVYLALGGLGSIVAVLLLLTSATDPRSLGFVVTIVGTGAFTLLWWARRLRGDAAQTRTMRLGARATIVVGTGVGLAVLLPDVAGALGIA